MCESLYPGDTYVWGKLIFGELLYREGFYPEGLIHGRAYIGGGL